jgi:arabinofuranan 3-O-arabinosyltransferase
MGRFGFPFLPYSETAVTTTGETSLVEVLRGTSHWLSYLGVNGHPWSPAGWQLVTSPGVIAATVAIAAAGLAGLARRDLPERRFLAGVALLGVLLVTAGHAGSLTGPVAEPIQDLLDGPLSAFRNVH